MGLFLYSLFCSIALCLSVCPYHTVWITVALQEVLKLGRESHATLFCFFRIVLPILVPLDFCINFRIRLLISAKISAGILTRIVSNLQISWGRCAVLKILCLPIHAHELTLHLFRSFKISLRHLLPHPFPFEVQHCRAPLMDQMVR